MTSAGSTNGLLSVLCLAAGCAAGPLSELRFANHEPITALDDRRAIPRPRVREPEGAADRVDSLVGRQAMYGLALPGRVPARSVNALDEVPDSSWFSNRIGVLPLTGSEVARGPNVGTPALPFGILAVKNSGTAPGFLVQDARGDRYLLKFDPRVPEAETGAEVVVQRLIWAAGYNVPENSVVYLERRDLAPASAPPKAAGERMLTDRDIDEALARVPHARSALGFRALLSKLLPGQPVGGFRMTGVRADDANDRIRHEHRRELRALKVFYAWLGNTDVKEANTLDTWIESPDGSGRGYLVHHLIDFGKSLGVWGLDPVRETDGWASHFDYDYAFRSLLTFGLWRRPWEGLSPPGLRGVGRYDSAHFDPGVYSPLQPYVPFLYLDRFDAFWAAKIIARFRAEQISAAVAAGAYSEPRARTYLTMAIMARRDRIVRHWFARVAPLDRFEVTQTAGGFRICALDLLLAYELGDMARTRYAVRTYDWRGNALGRSHAPAAVRGGRLCVSRLRPGRTHHDYTLVALETFRGDERLPPTVVHLARDRANGRLRVIGIERR
jgi:hypothetical protein